MRPREANSNARLTWEAVAALRAQVREEAARRKSGEVRCTVSSLAREYGISRTQVRRIALGLQWRLEETKGE